MLNTSRSVLLTFVALLLAALLPAGAHAAKRVKYPTVTKVSPLKLGIGDTITIRGKGYKKGKRKTTIVFKREGGRSVFVKADSATTTRLTAILPAKLLPYLKQKAGKAQATRFRIRVLSTRLGRKWTTVKGSPLIAPTAAVKGNPNDCDADGILNSKDTDDDNDRLSDTEESAWGLKSCSADSDGDGMSDGWEQLSAIDRNGKATPSPRKRQWPNPLDKADANVDNDGDGLSNLEEYVAWVAGGSKLRDADKDPYTSRLTYSGGNPSSDGRGRLNPDLWYMDRDGNGYLSDFERDADGDRIPNMDEVRTQFDLGRYVEGVPADGRIRDYGLFGQVYMDEAAEKFSEDLVRCAGVNQVPFYCIEQHEESKRPLIEKVDVLDFAEADTDADGVRDDLDDVDHDDFANLPEYLQELEGLKSGVHEFRHLDACNPDANSRFCLLGGLDIDGDGLNNRDDADDDGDLLADEREKQIGTDPLIYDTDGDTVGDGYEYLSALDLNSAALPYPYKTPYPNPLYKEDGDIDHDGDALTLKDEFAAWRFLGSKLPLAYSDGTQFTGGKVAAPAGQDEYPFDGWLSDDEKDADADGLSNWLERSGPLSGQAWWTKFIEDKANIVGCGASYTESKYPGPEYKGLSFVDGDSDGDGVLDGADDIDHDGFSNKDEAFRPANWCSTYVSTHVNGGDPYARVQPFNPCKPVYSDACHVHPPLGYYANSDSYVEDWASPIRP